MRRLEQNETLHGTRDGQVAVDRRLIEEFGLTDREALCAALVKRGTSLRDVADTLEISTSTAEKHVSALRRKLGVQTTQEAIVLLLGRQTEASPRITEGFGSVPSVDTGFPVGLDVERAERFRAASSLQDVLREMLSGLASDGAGALFYIGLPLAAASYRKADVMMSHAASDNLLREYRENLDWVASAIGEPLFAVTDGAVVIDAGEDDGSDSDTTMPSSFVAACHEEGLRYGITLGQPHGTGYFAVTALYQSMPSDVFSEQLDQRVEHLRFELRLAQNAAFKFGVLAREVGLTIRERDALSLLAEGRQTKSAAASLGISDRAFGQLVKRARTKLRATTTAEAIAKAMALNVLVFL